MLSSLLLPLSVAQFVEEQLGLAPLRTTLLPQVLRALTDLPELAGVSELVAASPGPVYSWRPENWLPRRSRVAGAEALEEHEAGCSLYFTQVERGVAALDRACRGMEHELGIPAQCVSVQAFASRAGGGVALHFDHDENFNVQLRGRKRWRMGANEFAKNPLKGGFWEHEFFRGLGVPTLPPLPQLEDFEVEPGCLTYVPRGFWHATDCREDSFAISFAVQPPYVFQVVLAALQRRFAQEPAARAFAVGVTRRDLPRNPDFLAAVAPLLRDVSAIPPDECSSLALPRTTAPAPSELSGARLRRRAPAPGEERLAPLVTLADGTRAPLRPAARWNKAVACLLSADDVTLDERLASELGCSLAELVRMAEDLVHQGLMERSA